MTSVPTSCYAATAVAVGGTIAATQMHSNTTIPKYCIASSLLSTSAVAAAVTHHSSLSKMPAWYCVVGGLAGASAIGYALDRHGPDSKVPMHCKLATVAGLALLVIGTAVLAKK
uniref:Uncharacterized protein n=1 Tax=Coccolithus braarudii TaxID=221442 RepID=A0A7S0L8Z3_9EUKA|mmetsp:Transcript_2712/g.5644  ORF Transcript_2712/g.5644 Transcript_2712/m.5644 type:complete len:114 (+) Transcript_2712:37-378(+)|eukprot:CAMPEP_0183333976 /NCGR_PEP_ID=MMETSP0164_2-20130417/2717_1 /TAXON_ID=221442 /ORGANISM="Coccolithus pelagicus ssp braarudi, Strain PLY182g" /LENGTH=113 /DNA_ID=CAMNT_0025503023 /DNA_START=25 /DNA_END=366 /DNA_ORIENTATION=+